MRILFLLMLAGVLVGCDKTIHEAGLPVNPNPPAALSHP
jgi:hypothetical protein